MKAKHVYESMNFEKSNSPNVSLGVGKIVKVKEMLKDKYSGRIQILTYKINSLDNIEICFTDKYKDRLRGSKDKEPLTEWIIRYIEKPQFVVKSTKTNGYLLHDDHVYNYYTVYKTYFNMTIWPNDFEFYERTEIEISKNLDDAEKKANLIAEAYNKEFGPVCGFEVIETIKTPIDEI